MKTLAVLFALTFPFHLFAQLARGTPQQMQALKDETLLVPLYKNAENYNQYIQEVVEDKWTFSSYKFVDYESLPTGKNNTSPRLSLTIGRNPGFYGAVLSFSNGYEFYSDIQFSYPQPVRMTIDSVVKRANSYSKERLELLFILLVNNLNAIKSGKVGEELKLDYTGKSIKEYYSDAAIASKLKAGILYIPKNDLKLKKPTGNKPDNELLEPGAIDEFYKGKYELVDEQTLAEAITAKSPNTYFLNAYTEGSVGVYMVVDLEKQKITFLQTARGAYGDGTVWKGMLKDLNKLIEP